MNVDMRQFFRAFLIIVLACSYFGQAGAAGAAPQYVQVTYRVAPTGQDRSDCGSEALPCRTIQYTANLANSGDILLVAEGTYTYNSQTDVCSGAIGNTAVICILNRELTILGGYTTTNWSVAHPDANVTVIDGQNVKRGVLIQRTGPYEPSAGLHMEGFIIQNGLAQGAAGGGDQQTYAFGGGMLTDASKIVLRHMILRNNRAVGGNVSSSYGGAGSGGGLALRTGPSGTSLEDVVFENNIAQGGTGLDRGGFGIGGGFYTYKSTLSGNHLTFINNVAVAGNSSGSGVAGGLMADGQGGGAAFQVGSNVTLQYVIATGNQSRGGDAGTHGGGAFGGALKAEWSTLRVYDAVLRGNQSLGGNGANGGQGCGGALETYNSDLILNRVQMLDNMATGGNGTSLGGAAGGGGASLSRFNGSSEIEISNTVVADNIAEMGTGTPPGGGGGGLWLQGTYARITHTTVAGNRLGSWPLQGQGILVLNDGAPTPSTAIIAYTIIANHTNSASVAASPGSGGDRSLANGPDGSGSAESFPALHVKQGNSATLERTLWANNDDDSNMGDWGAGTIENSYPVYASSAGFDSPGSPGFDYHLRDTSPAIDQATGSSTSDDMDGDRRPAMGGCDIGADEYVQPLNIIATIFLPLISR
jgi:hypothetical protein